MYRSPQKSDPSNCDNFSSIDLGPLWALQNGSGGFQLSDELAVAATNPVKIAQKPKFNCWEQGFRGVNLALCQRHYAILPELPMSKKVGTANSKKASSDGFNLDGNTLGYNFFLLSAKNAANVQDQGQEGACSAYGGTHTVIANLAHLGTKSNLSAANVWQQQSYSPMMMSFMSVMKRSPVDGFKVMATNELNTVAEFKATLDKGRAVYIGSEVSQSWYNPSGSGLSCGGSISGRHAYSIQGYDDAKQVFVVKNSWGADWGEDGYHYLPYKCISSFREMEAYDIVMGNTPMAPN